jgi:hypothetical protein
VQSLLSYPINAAAAAAAWLQVPGHTAAVLTFRGHVRGRDLVEKKKQELTALLAVSNMSHCHMTVILLRGVDQLNP